MNLTIGIGKPAAKLIRLLRVPNQHTSLPGGSFDFIIQAKAFNHLNDDAI